MTFICLFCAAVFLFYAGAITVLLPPRKGDRLMWLGLLVGGTLYLAFMLIFIIGTCV